MARAAPDTYVAVSMGQAPVTPGARLKSASAAGIYGVYLDIDFAGPAHRKPNLPPSMDDGVGLLDEFGPEPTLLVQTGHGLQGWWLFGQPWIFVDKSDQEKAAQLTRDWVDAHRRVAARHDWDHDPVGDLARLLRLPGTVNAKVPEEPAPVRLVSSDGPRYERQQLRDLIGTVEQDSAPVLIAYPPRPPQTAVDWGFTLDAGAEPPASKLEDLLLNPHAAGSWAHDRPDFQDQSPSAFDQSLATIAAGQEWSDQEIVDLLIACRRRNGSPRKLRPDYFRRTVNNARRTLDANQDDDEGEPSLIRLIKAQGLVPVLADILEDEQHFAIDGSGMVYRYDAGRYVPATQWISRKVRLLLERGGATREWRGTATKDLCKYLGAVAPRLWSRPSLDLLNLRNGLFDLGTEELRPHRPDHLSTIQLPIAYDPGAQCPAIDKFVAETFPEDAFELAFELAAFLMMADPSVQKAILLLGPGGNGKSVFLRLLQAMLGRENYATVPLQKLESDRFAASRLDGVLANICADLPASDLKGSSMFKGLTGGDRITAERKYHDSYDLEPFCKPIFSANAAPRTPDASDAFFDRWIVIPFERTFRGEATEIPSRRLDATLQADGELSGALNRALAGVRRLRERGLSLPLSCLIANEAFRAMTDPVSVWLDHQTMSVPGAFVSKRELLAAYNADAIRAGRPTMTANALGRAMTLSRAHVKSGQRVLAGRTMNVYLDLSLAE